VPHRSRPNRASWARVAAFLALLGALGAVGCERWKNPSELAQAERLARPSRWGTPSVYTTANRSVGEAVRSHFDLRSEPQQPFPFSHQIHLEKELVCTDCHEGVERGPRAGLPSINTCMICHSQIATDRPLIQQLTALQEKGIDLAWQRVYNFNRQAHVRFEHAPHIKVGTPCSTCHGNQAQQSVAVRAVDMDMAFCVNCHRQKQASNDCLTCHY
jgi:hypothetical protein